MATRIIYNDMTLVFRCDKKKNCVDCGLVCHHTLDIEHAVFDGEKTFAPRGQAYAEEL